VSPDRFHVEEVEEECVLSDVSEPRKRVLVGPDHRCQAVNYAMMGDLRGLGIAGKSTYWAVA
jgi:glycine cleavage system aminomethyltransferase T